MGTVENSCSNAGVQKRKNEKDVWKGALRDFSNKGKQSKNNKEMEKHNASKGSLTIFMLFSVIIGDGRPLSPVFGVG